MRRSLCVAIALAGAISSRLWAQGDAGDKRMLIGAWRGASTCVVKPSSCHDEEALYRFTANAAKPGWFSLEGDKVVDGKPLSMGISDCSLDRASHVVSCDTPAGSVHLEMKENQLRGTMTLKDGTLWRKLTLRKVD